MRSIKEVELCKAAEDARRRWAALIAMNLGRESFEAILQSQNHEITMGNPRIRSFEINMIWVDVRACVAHDHLCLISLAARSVFWDLTLCCRRG